jgi:transcription initiation factor TFIID subunit 6
VLSKKLKAEGKYDLTERRVDIKPLVRHVLSKELQLYYEKIVEALLSNSAELRNAALESMREDNGIQQLLPYFVQFITDQVTCAVLSLISVAFIFVINTATCWFLLTA